MGHKTAAQSGVAGVYSHYAFEAEKRSAAERWAEHIIEITREPEPTAATDNVVSFANGRRS